MATGNVTQDKQMRLTFKLNDQLKDLKIAKKEKQENYDKGKGWALNTAIAGRDANIRHLEAARQLLDKCIEDEGTFLTTSDTNEAAQVELENAATTLKLAKDKYDQAIQEAQQLIKHAEGSFQRATTKHEALVKTIKNKYKMKEEKKLSKMSDRYTLLQQRVDRLQSAVELSEAKVQELESKKPATIIAIDIKEQQIQAKKDEIEKVKDMTAKQLDSYKPKTRTKIVWGMPEHIASLGEDPRYDPEAKKREALREDRELRRKEDEKREKDRETYLRELRIKEEQRTRRQDEQRQRELAGEIPNIYANAKLSTEYSDEDENSSDEAV